MKIGSIKVSYDTTSIAQSFHDLAALALSVESLADILERIDCHFPGLFDNGGVLTNNTGDLLFRKPIDDPASGTSKVKGLELHPSDGYLVLFTTLASNRQSHVVFSHDWPVLFLASDIARMAETGGESIAPSGGLCA